MTLGPRGAPAAFTWQRQRIRVKSILDTWKEVGCWWDGEGQRTVYLAEGVAGGIYELHQMDAGAWILAKVYD